MRLPAVPCSNVCISYAICCRRCSPADAALSQPDRELVGIPGSVVCASPRVEPCAHIHMVDNRRPMVRPIGTVPAFACSSTSSLLSFALYLSLRPAPARPTIVYNYARNINNRSNQNRPADVTGSFSEMCRSNAICREIRLDWDGLLVLLPSRLSWLCTIVNLCQAKRLENATWPRLV